MKKSLIFDVDGTLWDSTESIAQSYNHTIKELGLKSANLTKTDVESFMGFLREEIADKVFADYPVDKRLEYIDICMENECKYLLNHPGMLYPKVMEVLEALHEKYDLYIISNCQDGYIEAMFASYDLQHLFIDYECSGRTGLKKSENIKLLMQRNDIKTATYIGDTVKDKQASEEANIPFIYASYGFGEIENYEPSVENFGNLIDLL